jgi:hypothetical protein
VLRAALIAQNITLADGQVTCKSGRLRVGWKRTLEEKAATVRRLGERSQQQLEAV